MTIAKTKAWTAPKTVLGCFAELDDALKLDPDVDASAKQIRATIDEVLEAAGMSATSLLQGSYGRKTMYPPLKDVDLVIILPKRLEHLRFDPQGPAKAMEAFRNAIVSSGRLPGARFDAEEEAAHALQMSLTGVEFTFDLVPAFETDDPDWLLIADREERRWDKRSDVRALRNKIMVRNGKCLGRWVLQVRHSKHAVRQVPSVKALVCGLLMESLAFDVITSLVSPQKAAEAVFAHGARVLRAPYVGLAQDDFTAKWTMLDRSRVVAFFVKNQQLAQEALRYEASGDLVAASATWREIFGEEFPAISPSTPVSFADQLAQVARLGGGVTSTGGITTSAGAPAATNPARPWRLP